ncbi:Aldose reductase B [Diplonema papillatum]|nr:Aldose reductase B [Diplonema papillatum]
MPRFDDLVVAWVKNASISKENKLAVMQYCTRGVADLEQVGVEKNEAAIRNSRKKVESLTYQLNSKAEEQSIRDTPAVKLPIIGAGLYFSSAENSKTVGRDSTYEAIKAGFRLLDTARMYDNEEEVGAAVRQAIDEGLVAREELVITTKVCNPENEDAHALMTDPEIDATEEVYQHVRQSVERLGTEPDIVLVHWPSAWDLKDTALAAQKRHDIWKGLEKAKEEGLTQSIGVSNFSLSHYDELITAGVAYAPAVNQLEINPFVPSDDLVDGSRQRGMIVQAYSPFGSHKHVKEMLSNEILVAIAEETDSTPAQVILSWLTQRGIIPLPRSTNPERMAENFAKAHEVIEFKPEHLAEISKLADGNKRHCPNPYDLA